MLLRVIPDHSDSQNAVLVDVTPSPLVCDPPEYRDQLLERVGDDPGPSPGEVEVEVAVRPAPVPQPGIQVGQGGLEPAQGIPLGLVGVRAAESPLQCGAIRVALNDDAGAGDGEEFAKVEVDVPNY